MYELQVEGMSCNHCVSRVTKSVRKIDDAAKVEVDLATGRVRVESSLPPEDISEAIAEAGYPARPV